VQEINKQRKTLGTSVVSCITHLGLFLFQFCETSFAWSQRTPGWRKGSQPCSSAAPPKVTPSRRLVGAKITAQSILKCREGEFLCDALLSFFLCPLAGLNLNLRKVQIRRLINRGCFGGSLMEEHT